MGLADFKLPTVTVNNIDFRGLSFNDLTALMNKHREDIDLIVQNGKSAMSKDGDLQQLIIDTLIKLPNLCASVIALAADEPIEQADVVKKLPFPTQVQILNEVFILTFSEVGGVGKFLELLVMVMRSASKSMNEITGIMS